MEEEPSAVPGFKPVTIETTSHSTNPTTRKPSLGTHVSKYMYSIFVKIFRPLEGTILSVALFFNKGKKKHDNDVLHLKDTKGLNGERIFRLIRSNLSRGKTVKVSIFSFFSHHNAIISL